MAADGHPFSPLPSAGSAPSPRRHLPTRHPCPGGTRVTLWARSQEHTQRGLKTHSSCTVGQAMGLWVVPSDLRRVSVAAKGWDLEEAGAEQGGLLPGSDSDPDGDDTRAGAPVPAHVAAPSPTHGHPARVGRGRRPWAWWALAAGALARGLLTRPHAPLRPAARHSLRDGAASFPGPCLSPAPGILPFPTFLLPGPPRLHSLRPQSIS